MISIMPQLAVAKVANGFIVFGANHVVLCASRTQALQIIDVVLANVASVPTPPVPEYERMLNEVAAGLKITPDAIRADVKSHQFGISPWDGGGAP